MVEHKGRRGVRRAMRKLPAVRHKRGWNFVFSQCSNCGHEIHRPGGRHHAWTHTNSSPWCPQLFGQWVESMTGSQQS